MKYSSLALIAVSGIVLTGCRGSNSATSSSNLDPQMVASCLKEKSVKMYGTERCPHCKEQKKLFGSAFSTVEYIDCDKEKVKCQLAGVQSIPTWIFADGSKLQGTQALSTLGKKAGCDLNSMGNAMTGSTGDKMGAGMQMDHSAHNMQDHKSMASTPELYVRNMIPHHQEAVDTAKIIVDKTQNTELKKLAQNIVSTQTEEIQMLRGRIADHFSTGTASASYQNMMPDLTKLQGTELDKAFLEGMIAHHQGAVDMSFAVLQTNPISEIVDFANDVMAVQNTEITQMKAMLANLKK